MKDFKIIDYISDIILVVKKKNLEINFVNNECEIFLELGCSKILKKQLSFFFEKSSILMDCINKSLLNSGKFVFPDIPISFNKRKIICNIEIINDLMLDNLIIFLKRESLQLKINQTKKDNFFSINEVILKVIDDFKNPISSIKGASQLLKQYKNNETKDLIEIINKESTKLLEIMKYFNPKQSFTNIQKKVNIHKFLREIFLDLKNESLYKFKIIENFDPSLPDIEINKQQIFNALKTIFKDLILNLEKKNENIYVSTYYDFGFKQTTKITNKTLQKNFLVLIVKIDLDIFENRNSNNFPFLYFNDNNEAYKMYMTNRIFTENNCEIDLEERMGQKKFIIKFPL